MENKVAPIVDGIKMHKLGREDDYVVKVTMSMNMTGKREEAQVMVDQQHQPQRYGTRTVQNEGN